MSVARFTYKLFKELGAIWNTWSKEAEEQLRAQRNSYGGHLNILEGKLNGHKLQVM